MRSLKTRILMSAAALVAVAVILAFPFAWHLANKCEGRIIEKRVAIPNTRWSPGLLHYFVLQTSNGRCQVAVPERIYLQANEGMFYSNTGGRNDLSNPTALPKTPR